MDTAILQWQNWMKSTDQFPAFIKSQYHLCVLVSDVIFPVNLCADSQTTSLSGVVSDYINK